MANVPQGTLLFWAVKIAATALAEPEGNAVSMSMQLGCLTATAFFAVVVLVAVAAQINACAFQVFLCGATIVATPTVGTTLVYFADRSLGIGYAGGSTLLLALPLGSLFAWHCTLGSLPVDAVSSPRAEVFTG